MKTTIEVNGYEIVIEETDGMVSVSAMKDDEIVEEFQLESDSESFEGDDDMDMDSEVKDFDDFEGDDDSEEDESEGKLESFQSFLKKRK
jgi:hypothetical protein